MLEHGPKVRITHERFEQVESYFQRHGGKTILIGRFIGLVRALAPFVAGSSRLPYRAFVPYSILGTGLWSATFCLLGYALSNSLNKASEIAGRGIFVFGFVVGVVVAGVVISRFLREPENRRKLAERIAATPVLRRLLPEIRFFWNRLTPGGLGLELTSLLAALSVALFVLVGYALIVTDDAGPTPGDSQAIDVVNDIQMGWLTDIAKTATQLGSTAAIIAVAVLAGGVLAWRRLWTEVARHGAWGQLRERARGPLGDLHLAGADDRDQGAPGVGLRVGGDRRRDRGHRAGRIEPRLLERPLPVRRQRRLGARGVGVLALCGDCDRRHSSWGRSAAGSAAEWAT